jgi:uncharacterized membrane protein
MSATLYMDELIVPHRSLSKVGFFWLIGALIAVNLLICSFLLAIGALPVPIFLGIDVIGVILAFRASYRGARQAERVQVSADEVRVSHEFKGRARTVWSSPTAFTRVLVELPGEDEARVSLRIHSRALILARALGPGERRAFADALEAAIRQARAERH